MRYAIIENNIVTNVIKLNDINDWMPPIGSIIVQSDSAGVNDSYVNGEFIREHPPIIPPTIIQQIEALERQITPRNIMDAIMGDAEAKIIIASIRSQVLILRQLL